MKKFLKNLQFLFCVILLFFASQLKAAETAQNSPENFNRLQFYFLIDADTKEVLLSKNADARVAPSSMTKLMTAYIVFEQIKKGNISLKDQCLIGKNAWRKNGSTMFLNYGDVVSVEDLLKGLLVVSGNDAAIALAEITGGGLNNFVNLMNIKAQNLGLKNSHFKNPHGLNEADHYMSMRDLANLAIAIYRDFPEYSNYLSIPEFTYNNINQRNRNPLIKENYDGVVGGKTGHTNEGGYGVIAIVKRDHRRLIAVINKAKTPKQRSVAVNQLLDYGFLNYKKLVLFKKNQAVINLKIWLGNKTQLYATTNEEIAFNIARQKPLESVKVSVRYNEPIYAPVSKGMKIANLIVEINDYKTFEYPLFARENIEKAGYFARIRQIIYYKIINFLK
jgi:D-alanyl-D-alanine carboxypeptidase (penicillin-binding protein 5/6)